MSDNNEETFQYIGDGVYCHFDGYGITLHANDHLNPTDKIYLETEVLEKLNTYYNNCITQDRN